LNEFDGGKWGQTPRPAIQGDEGSDPIAPVKFVVSSRHAPTIIF
jgi:hypothetical protein